MKTKTIIASVIAIVIVATNVVAPSAASAQTRHMCRGHVATIVGTPGRDVINGTSGPDVIVGLGGNDVIRGRGGADIICGNGGDDTITGNGGSDTLDGGRGKDRILGKGGNDVIFGGPGKDVIRGAKGNDTVYGQKGKDRIYGGSGSDRLHGGNGNDVVDGGSGNDHLDGGLGADTIRAGAGTDYCVEGLLSGCAPTRLGREISSVTSERCDFWGRWSTDTRDVNGRVAEHALSCSADDIGDQGWIEYDLGRRYNRFGAQVGIDDDALAISDRYRFRVYGDGALLHSVDVGFGELVPINVSVSGVLRLRLEITKIDGLNNQESRPTWATPTVSGASDLVMPTLPRVRAMARPRLGTELPIVVHERCDFWGRWRVGVRTINGSIHTDSLSCESDDVGDAGWTGFKLSRAYTRLETSFGVDDSSVSSTDVYRVRIYGDGQLLEQFDSGFGQTRGISLDVTGVLRLVLSVEKIGGPDNRASTAVFAEPTLVS